MPGRVLNFLEFSDKYSKGDSEPLSVDAIASAASGFEEGFDDTTYDQPELGPKRPVSGEYEATPAGPGETFSQENSPEMDAPKEIEGEISTSIASDEEEEPADEESEPVEDDEEDEESMGNPEEANESITLVKGFSQFVNESSDWEGEYYEDCPDCGGSGESRAGVCNSCDGEGMIPLRDTGGRMHEETCSNCGEPYQEDEYGVSCGCNM